ncbi:MAG: four helix bundle protein [Terracidiphilus sp.]
MAKSFRELLVWQKGIQLSVLVCRLSKQFPREETYGLSDQMRRAAVSIPSNIAEGAGRLNTQEYKRYLGVARGSSFELQTQLTIAGELGFGDVDELHEAESTCDEIGRMLFGVIQAPGVQHEKPVNASAHSHSHSH